MATLKKIQPRPAQLIEPGKKESTPAEPANGKSYTLAELYKLLDCDTIEVIYLPKGELLIFDENGKMTDKPYNDLATKTWYCAAGYTPDVLVGKVILCPAKYLK